MSAICSPTTHVCCVVQLLASSHFLALPKDLRKDLLNTMIRHYEGEENVPETTIVVPNFYKTLFSAAKLKRHVMAMVPCMHTLTYIDIGAVVDCVFVGLVCDICKKCKCHWSKLARGWGGVFICCVTFAKVANVTHPDLVKPPGPRR